jgi:hypothetical protein
MGTNDDKDLDAGFLDESPRPSPARTVPTGSPLGTLGLDELSDLLPPARIALRPAPGAIAGVLKAVGELLHGARPGFASGAPEIEATTNERIAISPAKDGVVRLEVQLPANAPGVTLVALEESEDGGVALAPGRTSTWNLLPGERIVIELAVSRRLALLTLRTPPGERLLATPLGALGPLRSLGLVVIDLEPAGAKGAT